MVVSLRAEVVVELPEGATPAEQDAAKAAAVHRLIHKLGGTQDPALGTVVCDLDLQGDPIRLWIREWE